MEAEFARRARREREREERARRKREREGEGGGGQQHHRHSHHPHHRHHHNHHHHQDHQLSAAHRLHVSAGLAAVAAFFLEDACELKVIPRIPFVHSAWHVLSAVSMAATGPLVDDAERRLERGRERAKQARGGIGGVGGVGGGSV